MKSSTELIVGESAYWMEFDLTQDIGYQEWRGMFLEAGALSQLFNGYMVQISEDESMVSTNPVKLNLFSHAMYIAPPLEQIEYYMEIPRSAVSRGRLYFKLQTPRAAQHLEGYKPPLETWLALDLWTRMGGVDTETVVTLFYEANFRSDKKDYHVERVKALPQ